MNKYKKLVFIGCFILIIASLISGKVFFPTDVLNNIPSFSESQWAKPKNSLLGDPVFQFEPWRQYAKSEIRNGRFPLWNNLNSHGVPLFANFQSAVLYPLNFLYYLLPEKLALFIIPLLKLIILGFGMYLYLKELRLAKEISLIGGVGAACAAFPMMWLLWPHTNVFILLPFILFLTEHVYSNKRSHRQYLGISLFYAAAIFGGHPETLAHIVVIHGIYIITRFWRKKELYLKLLTATGLGFLLGAIQIVPFLEYLKHSYVLTERSENIKDILLPLQSIIVNIFPFILGAPHSEINRAFSLNTNFQEAVGGYVGLIFLIGAFLGISKNRGYHTKFWASIILLSLLLSYKVWPFYLISQLPLLRLSANHRMVAYIGFGLIIIFCFFLESVRKEKKEYVAIISSKLLVILGLITIALGLVSMFITSGNSRLELYISTVRMPLLSIILSTLLFVWTFNIKKNKFFPAVVVLCILLQSLFLFWNYNPFTDEKTYYPETALTSLLIKQSRGTYLEVGNPSLPANVNMVYGLKNIQNYDAIENGLFKKNFDIAFPSKNSWGNPDEITLNSVLQMRIDYLLSDFDINLKKQTLQSKNNIVNDDGHFAMSFTPAEKILRQIRIKPATYNRLNSCNTEIALVDTANKELFKKNVDCRNFRNNMFYVVDIENVILRQNKTYRVLVKVRGTVNNTVGFYGATHQPFMQLLYEDTSRDLYTQIGRTKYVSVFKPRQRSGNTVRSARVLYEDAGKSILDVDAKRDTTLIFDRSYYPGWGAEVNGEHMMIVNKDGFIGVHIPEGKSYINLSYKPNSYAIGGVISIISFILSAYFFIKNEKEAREKIVGLKKKLRHNLNKISWLENSIVTLGALGVSSLLFLSFALHFPFSFNNTSVSTISWYTQHNLSKTTEYFYFYSGLFSILIVSLLIWITYIWRKK